MLRIALIRNAYSFDYGGAEKFPVYLATELKKYDFEPIIITRSPKLIEFSKNNKLKIIRGWWWSRQGWDGKYALAFPVYLFWQSILIVWYIGVFIKHKIDIVHPQSRDDFIAATVAGKLLNKKVIWTDHADLKYVLKNQNKIHKNPIGKLVYLSSKLANQILLTSFSEKKLIEKSLGRILPERFSVVYIGVSDTYKSSMKSRDKIVFVSTSRLVKAKGIGELIEAFTSLKNSSAILKLYGDGPEADYYKSITGDINNIKFMGHVDNVIKVLSESDIFVHPSYHESFGLSLVEAEMCFLPIIACNTDSIPEIVKDGVNGILVKPKNTFRLTKAMRLLIDKPELRHAMGKASRKIYLKNFQFNKIVKQKFIPLYKKLP